MTKLRLEYLLAQYLSNSLSPQEHQEWLGALENPEQVSWLSKLIDNGYDQLTEEELIGLSTQQANEVFANIIKVQLPTQKEKISLLWRRVPIAAAVLIMLSFVIYFTTYQKDLTRANTFENDIPAGKIGASLTLANGEKISLENTANGKLAEEAGVVVMKTGDGKLVYQIKDSKAAAGKMNTLSTANGQTYHVLLPDGTSVSLNAASTLSYPASFAQLKERKVELTGEGYFQVAKDEAHPFIVSSENQEISVLGTHFNVSAYSGETIKTTLLEGSVKVGTRNSGEAKEAVLKPGEQSSISPAGLSIKEVDAEYAVAWTNGYFLFNNETLKEAMLKIGRWYNVQIIYDDLSLKDETLFGTISRFGNISGVLKMMERADVVRFTITDNTIHVKRKK